MSNNYNSKVIILNNPRDLIIEDEILPKIKESEILCETLCTAISPGSELAHYKGLPPLIPNEKTYPRKLGYCNVSKVIKVGSSVKSVIPGEKVLTFAPHRSSFIINESLIKYVLPKGANAELISTSYLYHLGYNAVLRGGIKLGSRVLVIGLGTLGLTTLTMSKIAGGIISVISDQFEKKDLALDLGAINFFSREQIMNNTIIENQTLFDVVVITTNNWQDLIIAQKLTTNLGKIAVLGHLGRGKSQVGFNPLPSEFFQTKQLTIEAVGYSPEYNDSRGFARFNEIENLKYIANQINIKKINPNRLITGRYHFTEIEKAYKSIISKDNSSITYILKWQNY